MKKSRIAKLALLGASTAALAATLTTSTYAWYVSTTKADITNGTGATGTAGADESLLLSWTNTAGSWYSTLNFNQDSDAVKNPLYPISFRESKWGKLDPAAGDSSTSTASTDYIQFEVYLLAGTDITVRPTMTITNASGSATWKQQMIIQDGAAHVPSSAASGVFTVNALEAIWTEQNVGGTKTYKPASTTGTGGNAHDYYDAVKDASTHVLTDGARQTVNVRNNGGTATGASTALADIELDANTAQMVTYTIFLDGGDVDCFNACVGQNITFALSFEKVTS